ncbi:MAG: malto-oligosyltrehalose trehalohydrolase [Vicinamibacterales bacterium]
MRDGPFRIGAWREGLSTSLRAGGTHFRVWAPRHTSVELALDTTRTRELRPLVRDDRGYWSAVFDDIGPGAAYRYRLGGDDARVFPDPASRYQPEGVHGPSEVVDLSAFPWTDEGWRPPRREDLVVYELHGGTFSPQGTFRGALERLPHLAQLGVSAIELMPVGDFPGSHNWGYDGVAIFAPSRAYGRPEDLQALVNAAHQHGLAVLLDVVYNHLGPDGAYANAFSPYYFTDRHKSPWGQGVNMDGPHSADVRAFFVANAVHWVRDYHVDGLRLDATHAIQDDGPRHFLEELTATLRAATPRPVVVIAEDHRNLAKLALPARDGGWGLDGIWADDFHHQVRVHVTHDREGYYADFSGTADDIAETIRRGWFFTGQASASLGGPRGTDPEPLDPRQLVVCVQNHDQIGNRADGARLHHQVDAATYRAVSALLLMAPETPLLFQGQEWATRAPFLYFTDHHPELGRQVTIGRREEFSSFSAFADPVERGRIPDPQAPATFERSRLRWEELERPEHASVVRLYQRLIALRATAAPLRVSDRGSYDASALDEETILLMRRNGAERLWIAARLGGTGRVTIGGAAGAQVLLTTEDPDLATDPQPIGIDARDGHASVFFTRPGAIVLHSSVTG